MSQSALSGPKPIVYITPMYDHYTGGKYFLSRALNPSLSGHEKLVGPLENEQHQY